MLHYQATGSTTSDVRQRHSSGAGTLPPHVRSAGEPVYQLAAGLHGNQRAKPRQDAPASRHGPLSREHGVTLVTSVIQ